MKFIKSITYIFIISLSLSCAQDYDKEVILQDTSSMTAEISVIGNQFASGISVPFTFTLPQSFNKKAIVTVQAESSEYVTTTTSVTIDIGATTGSGNITLPSLSGSLTSFEPVLNLTNVKIAGISTVDEVDNEGTIELVPSSDDTTIVTSNIVSLAFFNQLADDRHQDTSMSYLFDWVGVAEYNINVEVIDRAFTKIYEKSYSVSRYESDYFDKAHPDGDYDFYLRVYAASKENPTTIDIPYKIFTLHPDGKRDLLEGTLPAGSPTEGKRIDIGNIVKAGNTYSISLD